MSNTHFDINYEYFEDTTQIVCSGSNLTLAYADMQFHS